MRSSGIRFQSTTGGLHVFFKAVLHVPAVKCLSVALVRSRHGLCSENFTGVSCCLGEFSDF